MIRFAHNGRLFRGKLFSSISLRSSRASSRSNRFGTRRISNLRLGSAQGFRHTLPPTSNTRSQSLPSSVFTGGDPSQIKSNMAKKILVVDDNPTIRRLLCHLFDADENYEICAVASNGEEAISLAVENPPHLIILDLSMPVMDGLASARELKRRLPDVPIILFTQYADLGRHLLRSDLPVDRIVSKSESIHLMQHVRSVVPV